MILNQRQTFDRPKMDRKPFHDDRSRAYGVRNLMLAGNPDQKRFWEIPRSLPLNQGSEGACVGFGWSAELAVEPVTVPVGYNFAIGLYEAAQGIDRAEGRFYQDGATVLAGAKAAQKLGLISSYNWAFGIEQVRDALIGKGPVVIGINWYEGMYETEPSGLVRVNGMLVGGHCITLTGYWPFKKSVNGRSTKDNSPFGQTVYEWINSWGATYGDDGKGFIRQTDLDRLLKEDGEAVIAADIAPKPPQPKWRRIVNAVRRELW